MAPWILDLHRVVRDTSMGAANGGRPPRRENGVAILGTPMARIRGLVTASLFALSLFGMSCQGADTGEGRSQKVPQIGGQAPPFVLPSAAGGEVSLQGFQGRSPVLLYFSMGPG